MRSSNDSGLLWGRKGTFLLHEITFRDIFFLNLIELVDVFFDVCLENHEIVDKILMITPNALCISIVLNQTKFLFGVVMKYDTTFLGF